MPQDLTAHFSVQITWEGNVPKSSYVSYAPGNGRVGTSYDLSDPHACAHLADSLLNVAHTLLAEVRDDLLRERFPHLVRDLRARGGLRS